MASYLIKAKIPLLITEYWKRFYKRLKPRYRPKPSSQSGMKEPQVRSPDWTPRASTNSSIWLTPTFTKNRSHFLDAENNSLLRSLRPELNKSTCYFWSSSRVSQTYNKWERSRSWSKRVNYCAFPSSPRRLFMGLLYHLVRNWIIWLRIAWKVRKILLKQVKVCVKFFQKLTLKVIKLKNMMFLLKIEGGSIFWKTAEKTYRATSSKRFWTKS